MHALNDYCLLSASPENPLFFITRRTPAGCFVALSPADAYGYIARRMEKYKNDPVKAMDFELTGLKAWSRCRYEEV